MSWFKPRTPLAEARWVVLDCETSGLDARRDRLLSIGALRVSRNCIHIMDFFSSRVAAATPSAAENILVHGIGADAQLAAPPAADVLPQFARFVDDAVAVAYDAWFDREVLDRAGLRGPRRWLDLAPLASRLLPRRKAASFDEWLAAFGIEHAGRHDALLDALAAAELLLVLLAEARRQGAASVEDLVG